MRFGFVVFVLTMLLLSITIVKVIKTNFASMIVIICIHSMIEQHLFELHYNIFFMLAFANFNIQDDRKNDYKKNKK